MKDALCFLGRELPRKDAGQDKYHRREDDDTQNACNQP
jgi:hypothetical protein